MGVWIETDRVRGLRVVPPSLPAWECGLKRALHRPIVEGQQVTPRVGVWIETVWRAGGADERSVTPRVGVWIETNAHLMRPMMYPGHSPRGSVD